MYIYMATYAGSSIITSVSSPGAWEPRASFPAASRTPAPSHLLLSVDIRRFSFKQNSSLNPATAQPASSCCLPFILCYGEFLLYLRELALLPILLLMQEAQCLCHPHSSQQGGSLGGIFWILRQCCSSFLTGLYTSNRPPFKLLPRTFQIWI